jgi:hypothetical protein
MALKTAVGKNLKVSAPSAGTLSKLSTKTPAIGITQSKKSSSDRTAVEKSESSKPSEIIAMADFNRVYARSVRGRDNLTNYGSYYTALDAVHSITTEDVNYIVSKSIEADGTGAWSSLRDQVESDTLEAQDFVEDLANLLEAIVRAEKSLDFIKEDDEMASIARDFLNGKVRSYHTPLTDRKLTTVSLLGSESKSLRNIDGIKLILQNLKENLEIDDAYKEVINDLGQSRPNDLNLRDGVDHGKIWDSLEKFGTSAATPFKAARIYKSAELLSKVLTYSTGIARVKNDPISTRIQFDASNLAAPFAGATEPSDPLPPVKNLSTSGLGSNSITLSLLQFDLSNSTTCIPFETDDAPDERSYVSGPNALIRNPIRDGDFNFSNFNNFALQFSRNQQELIKYLELLLGFLDQNNGITPSEILRRVVANFVKGLGRAKDNDDAFYQLHALSLAKNPPRGLSFGRGDDDEDAGRQDLRQEILRVVAVAKHVQITRNIETGGADEDSDYKTTLSTAKVSANSESLKTDATATTTQVQDKSPKPLIRDVTRLASSSPTKSLAEMMYKQVVSFAADGPPSRQEINAMINSVKKKLTSTEESISSTKIELAAVLGFTVVYSAATFGVGAAIAVPAAKSVYDRLKYLEEKAEAYKEKIKDLTADLNRAPVYNDPEKIKDYYNSAKTSLNSGFYSCILDTYNEIIEAAKQRLPEGTTMIDLNRVTRFGQFDEFGLLGLIVDMFIQIASLLNFTTQKDSNDRIIVPGGKSLLGSFKIELNSMVSVDVDNSYDSFEYDEAVEVMQALSSCRAKDENYQNCVAMLDSFSTAMLRSSSDLVATMNDILSNSRRRAILDTDEGRNMMSSLTNQQIVYRRSLLERYRPSSSNGYLPARVSYSYNESRAMSEILSSTPYSESGSENIKISFCGLPAGTLKEGSRYIDSNIGFVNSTAMLELVIHKKDHELDDLLFKEKIFLFDPQLYVVPSSFDNFDTKRSVKSGDKSLEIAKKVTYTLFERDGSIQLNYESLLRHDRYKSLTPSQIDQIIKNTLVSYVLETYVYKTTGMIFDEASSFSVYDSLTAQAVTAINAVSLLNLPDLRIPSSPDLLNFLSTGTGNIESNDGLTTGDRELMIALASSYMMRSEKLIDRLLKASSFDRVFVVPVDPDKFEIDLAQTKKINGQAGEFMIQALTKQGKIVEEKNQLYVIARDAIGGGFSIGSLSCQFIPNTVGSESGTLLRVSKDFGKGKDTKKPFNVTSTKKVFKAPKMNLAASASTSIKSTKVSKGLKR